MLKRTSDSKISRDGIKKIRMASVTGQELVLVLGCQVLAQISKIFKIPKCYPTLLCQIMRSEYILLLLATHLNMGI